MVKKNKLVVVLGMHRSGTSAITRGLQVMGVDLGDKLIPSIEDINDKGFWEDVDINTLNDEMLKALGSDWHYLTPISSSDIEFLQENGYFLRAVELLQKKVEATISLFGFKDPRVAKLLAFWKQVFDYCQLDICYVLAVRHPLSVAKSLEKRDGFDKEKSYFLWLGHIMTSLTDSVGCKRVLIDYDLLMQSPDYELNRVAKEFDLKIDTDELQRYKSEFLTQDLRHTVYNLEDLLLDDACPAQVKEIYTLLLDVASEKISFNDIILQKKIEYWVSEFESLKSCLILLDRFFVQITGLNEQIIERNTQITERDVQITERDVQITERDVQIAERDAQIANVNNKLATIYASISWRMTKPIRSIENIINHI